LTPRTQLLGHLQVEEDGDRRRIGGKPVHALPAVLRQRHAAAEPFHGTLSKLVARTAMEVHWRAYQETVISSVLSSRAGPVGPASAMFYEIFTKRSFTRIFGKHDTAALIREPGGWMALNDKLMLM